VKAHRFAALDAWRGICALLVALEHLSTTSVLHQNSLTRHSYRFVDFFFVLSGVVVAHAYRERLQRDPEHGAISRALKRRAPLALGAWSYSIYMVHVLLALGLLITAMIASKYGLHVFARVDGIVRITGPAAATAGLTVIYLGAVILLASFTYRHIALPGQRWFGRLAARGRHGGADSTA
jgi:peptidoglycan/LPS O-acetylase OafA/YrhL